MARTIARCSRCCAVCPPVCPVWDCDVLRCGETLNGYRIDRFLGKGGFGAVYRATSLRDPREQIAIKIFADDVKRDFVNGKERIRQETRILKQLEGNGVPHYVGDGTIRRRPYVMMEYVDAFSADDLPTKPGDVRRFVVEVLESLAALHKAGWLHCDLKPINLGRRLEDGRVVLFDFGSAHLIEREATHVYDEHTINLCNGEYVAVGTRGYMPPELSFRPSRDIYAFGHMLRDCFRLNVPLAWSMVIDKCIANRAECRYATIEEVLSDVRNLDQLARREMEERIREWRQRQIEIQREIVKQTPVRMSVRELMSRLETLRGSDSRFYVGKDEVLIDLPAMGMKSLRVTTPMFLRNEKLFVMRGPGVVRIDLSGDPVGTHSVVLMDGATLINSSRLPPYESNFNYCVGEHCYANLKGLARGTKLVHGSHWVSDAGNAFIRCGGPDCVAELLGDVDLALWDDTAVVHDEYFGRGAYANRPGLARYLCEHGDYFNAMGVQRRDLLTRLSDAFGIADWLKAKKGAKKRPLVCLGAIIGNICASRFGHSNPKTRAFELFVPECRMTADGSMTVAVMAALLAARKSPEGLSSCAVKALRIFGRMNHDEFGMLFQKWIFSDDPRPYGSWGNGAAMRVSPCAWIAKSLDEALELARIVTGVTHNHPEGIKGAESVAAAIYLAREGKTTSEIRDYVREQYYPNLNFTLDEIRATYKYDSGCPGSVPQALEAFFEATDFESALRNAVSIGGDVDTTAAIACSVAEAAWGISARILEAGYDFLESPQRRIIKSFSQGIEAAK